MMGLKWTGIAAAAIAAVLAAAPAEAQKSKDTLRFAFQRDTKALDSILDAGIHTAFTQPAVFDTLMTYNERTQSFEPGLSKSWTRVSSTVTEFELRDDVKWHDGQPFGADDVVYTLGWVSDENSKIRFRTNWEWLKGAEKIGPYKVRVISKRPTPFDFVTLGQNTPIMPNHAHGPLANKIDFAPKAVGTGPYRLAVQDINKEVVLERNESYKHGGDWKSAGKIKRINIALVPDYGTQVSHMLAGNYDMLHSMPWPEAAGFEGRSGYRVEAYPSYSYVYLMFDATGRSGVKPIQDPKVREALMMAINVDDIYKIIGGDTKLAMPEHICWKKQAGCDYTKLAPKFDIEGAKKLLTQAGYPNGFELEVYSADGLFRGVNEAVTGMFRKIGVTATSRAINRTALEKQARDGKVPLFATIWSGGGVPDVYSTMGFFFDGGEPASYIGHPELKVLAEKSDGEMDPVRRKDLVRQVMDGLMQDYTLRALVPNPNIYVLTPDVEITQTGMIAGAILPWGIAWKK